MGVYMKYLGNYVDWIDDKWIEYIINNDGRPMPDLSDLECVAKIRGSGPGEDKDNPLGMKWTIGRPLEFPTCCYQYDLKNTDFIINPPWDIPEHSEWWINKFTPLQLGPMHKDGSREDEPNVKYYRYWMPFQDYELGHFFIYEHTLITGYKKGDLYIYEDPEAQHCAGNAGWSPRISLNITAWEYL
jgi:hypothetical protein